MKKLIVSGALVILSAAMSYGQASERKAVLDQYCIGCHNDTTKSGGLALTALDSSQVAKDAAAWERVIRKLRAGMMPPSGAKRPAAGVLDSMATALETELDTDAKANPNPGRKAIHRLNRTEYANSVRDLLAMDFDASAYLPIDDSTHGFDNMAEVLTISPTLMESYVRAASKISRAAVGDSEMSALVESYSLPQGFSQMKHVEGTPFGTRGGIAVNHVFPLSGDYVFRVDFYHLSTGPLFGQSTPGEKIEIAVDGERVALLDINPNEKITDYLKTPEFRVTAGPHLVSAAFIQRAAGPVQDFHTPFDYALSDLTTGSILGLTGLPHLKTLGVSGPFNVTGAGDTPSRKKIFICHPAAATEEPACAKKIISQLAREAFRRPVSDVDVKPLVDFYQNARKKSDFEGGIRMAIQSILADPEFIYRFERRPATAKPGTSYRVSDLELASRLSFFLWSSAPDDELITVASQGKLKDPAVLEQQTRRMLADRRSATLATNFAGQWLFLRNLKDVQPDNYIFLDFDYNLRDAMQQETELFFDYIVRQDRNVMELLDANYTFVNERLAKHYGIPNIQGSRFQRVEITDDNRKGLLGQASILTLTSLSNRTSPVTRGKWVLENLLGVHPPPPPPNVPALKEDEHGKKVLSVRERLEDHRSNPSCAACHKMMDPIGFSLDNFDAVGAWRTKDNGFDIDASGQLVDGTPVNGPASLREALVHHSDVFLSTFTEKLLTFALGRGVDYYDMPTVREIVRNATKQDTRFTSFVVGIVKSVPFQMRKAEEAEPAAKPGAIAGIDPKTRGPLSAAAGSR